MHIPENVKEKMRLAREKSLRKFLERCHPDDELPEQAPVTLALNLDTIASKVVDEEQIRQIFARRAQQFQEIIAQLKQVECLIDIDLWKCMGMQSIYCRHLRWTN